MRPFVVLAVLVPLFACGRRTPPSALDAAPEAIQATPAPPPSAAPAPSPSPFLRDRPATSSTPAAKIGCGEGPPCAPGKECTRDGSAYVCR